MRRTLPLSVFLFASILLPSTEALAAPTPAQLLRPASLRINLQSDTPVMKDFTLGPTRFILSMAPGEERTVEVELTNREGEASIYKLTTEDFIADPEHEGTPTFYADTMSGPYSARLWITPEIRRLQLNHAERAYLRVTVRVPRNADAGDHQAALIIMRDSSKPAVSGIRVIPRVASLFVISVQGDVVQAGSMSSLSASRYFNWSLPVALRLVANNTGTVHMAPEGTVDIRNIFGITVDQIPFKDWVILRGSSRARDFTWSPRFALGRYTATTHFTAFNGRPLNAVSTAFWVIPLLPVLIFLLLIFLVSFGVQYFFSRFEVHRKGDDDKSKSKSSSRKKGSGRKS